MYRPKLGRPSSCQLDVILLHPSVHCDRRLLWFRSSQLFVKLSEL